MRFDIFTDTFCPLCGSSEHLDRIEHIHGRDQTGLVVFCRRCEREFVIITHVFGEGYKGSYKAF
ncbi:hypothetical protein [Hydrogenivirga sp. 128-5-R1-1]|uniref:hypothetical protein n=1 Tax=Hydrogenivirga sp. 128-5-R1-1 TaxID=392423 RepID=UPI00015F16BE|nr:hypothetical protein [Hydrogenivirga sp. 128-5-R1-1]EDP76257.1 hypothetical protein HG1285_18844 [Hydrogenivirga sp. 128-5-R1-1]